MIKLREGVTFHDGEKMDAAAVKYNLERHKNMKGSNRRGELAEMSSVDVVDASTVRINLSAPFAPLLAVLTDRSGMMVSPKAAEAAGEKFGAKPVCSGPFRFVERIAQDRIVLERFPNYWNKGQIHFDRIVYQPIADATVRLANLRSGQLDFIERLAPSDVPQLRSDSRFKHRQDRRARLPGHHHQRRQERPRAEEPARQGPARARGVRALARPRGARQGGDGRRGPGRQPVGPAEQPLLREVRAGTQAQPRAREAAAQGSRRDQSRASR